VAANPPSARFEPGNPRPIGFQDEASPNHIDQASAVLDGVASEITRCSSGQGTELAICLCNVRFSPGSPFVLFGFHILDIDDQGGFVDPTKEGHEVRFALVVNQPAEVQAESALAFCFQLVERQIVVARAIERDEISEIDRLTSEADRGADQEFADVVRYGWQEAAAAVARKANDAGLSLKVRYQRDPFSSRDELARRMPALRAVYDEIDSARRAIDNTVSMVGGSHPHVRLSRASGRARDVAQSTLAVLAMRQFQNQVTRDAEVCGNGYMVTSEEVDISPRCLRPEAVEIVAPGRFVEIRGSQRLPVDGVLHLRGLDQLDSPYGISVLESILFALEQVRTFKEAKGAAEHLLSSPKAGPDHRQWAQSTIALADRTLAGVETRLSQLLGFSRDHLPEARPDLYFKGQEEFK
jgi:hypothetical protein